MRVLAKPFGITLGAALALGLAAPPAAEACWWLFKRPGRRASRGRFTVRPATRLPIGRPPTGRAPVPPRAVCAAIPGRTATEPAGGEAPIGFRMTKALPWILPVLAFAIPASAGDEAATLLAHVDAAIALGKRAELATGTTPPWEVLHAIIAFEKDAELLDPATGRRTPAVAYLCERMDWDGVPVFCPAPAGLPSTGSRSTQINSWRS